MVGGPPVGEPMTTQSAKWYEMISTKTREPYDFNKDERAVVKITAYSEVRGRFSEITCRYLNRPVRNSNSESEGPERASASNNLVRSA
jgi:hypothetical protein